MSLEVTGTLIKFYDEKTFPSGFCVREFVLRTDEKYPQEVVLQVTGNAQGRDKIDMLTKFNINDVLRVKFNLRGREASGRHYNSLDAWAIDLASNAGGAQATNPSQMAQNAPAPTYASNSNPIVMEGDVHGEEDLPF
jgi:single-strand DNA-binding protein